MAEKLPAKHALDWFDRLGRDLGAVIVSQTARTVTMELSPAARKDLVADAQFYFSDMYGAWTGGVDYRGPAHTLLKALGACPPWPH